jgi:hypothetical protein
MRTTYLSGSNRQPNLLKGDDLRKLKEARISGPAFLIYAGDEEFFEERCNLSIGTSVILANLARELRETTGIKSKLLSFVPRTPRKQQANNVTGNRQQAGDAEMPDTASKDLLPIEKLVNLIREIGVGKTAGTKSKLLSFIPCTPRRQQANNLISKCKRCFQGRNQVPIPTSSCKNERCEMEVSTTPGTIRDTCNERSQPLRPLQE